MVQLTNESCCFLREHDLHLYPGSLGAISPTLAVNDAFFSVGSSNKISGKCAHKLGHHINFLKLLLLFFYCSGFCHTVK